MDAENHTAVYPLFLEPVLGGIHSTLIPIDLVQEGKVVYSKPKRTV